MCILRTEWWRCWSSREKYLVLKNRRINKKGKLKIDEDTLRIAPNTQELINPSIVWFLPTFRVTQCFLSLFMKSLCFLVWVISWSECHCNVYSLCFPDSRDCPEEGELAGCDCLTRRISYCTLVQANVPSASSRVRDGYCAIVWVHYDRAFLLRQQQNGVNWNHRSSINKPSTFLSWLLVHVSHHCITTFNWCAATTLDYTTPTFT